jgi:rod shape-determining protein MreB
VSRVSRVTSKPTRRGRNQAVAIDPGTSTIRLWTPAEEFVEITTSTPDRHAHHERSEATGDMLSLSRGPIRGALPSSLRRRRRGFAVVVAIPARASVAGRRRVEAAAEALNRGGPVVLMESPLAAAAGARVDITGTTPKIVVDVGVHGSEAAVLADGRVIDVVSSFVGCHDVERAVLAHVYRRHHVLAAPHAAWRALRGGTMTAFAAEDDRRTEIRVNQAELAADLSVPIAPIVGAVRRVVERAASRLAADPLEGGIVVVGGGGCLPSLIDTMRAEFAVRTTSAPDPRRAVIRGLSEFVSEAARHPRLWTAQ